MAEVLLCDRCDHRQVDHQGWPLGCRVKVWQRAPSAKDTVYCPCDGFFSQGNQRPGGKK